MPLRCSLQLSARAQVLTAHKLSDVRSHIYAATYSEDARARKVCRSQTTGSDFSQRLLSAGQTLEGAFQWICPFLFISVFLLY